VVVRRNSLATGPGSTFERFDVLTFQRPNLKVLPTSHFSLSTILFSPFTTIPDHICYHWGNRGPAPGRRGATLTDPEGIKERLRAQAYVASDEIATVLYLAEQLDKPVLAEGPCWAWSSPSPTKRCARH
jgi:hypothetical protein